MAEPANWHLDATSSGPPPTVMKQSTAVLSGICNGMRASFGAVRGEGCVWDEVKHRRRPTMLASRAANRPVR